MMYAGEGIILIQSKSAIIVEDLACGAEIVLPVEGLEPKHARIVMDGKLQCTTVRLAVMEKYRAGSITLMQHADVAGEPVR